MVVLLLPVDLEGGEHLVEEEELFLRVEVKLILIEYGNVLYLLVCRFGFHPFRVEHIEHSKQNYLQSTLGDGRLVTGWSHCIPDRLH